MRIGSLRREVISRLAATGVSRPGLEADLLLADFLGVERAFLYAFPDREVPPVGLAAFDSLVKRREHHEPIEYILGKAEFYGLPLSVGPGCLIPRPETELLVELALGECRGGSFLDWGTGSGCLSVALLDSSPHWKGVAVDASPAALNWAWQNLREYGFLDRCLLLHANSPEMVPLTRESLDLVISNPPYIPTEIIPDLMPEVRDYEPKLALDGGEYGLLPYASLLCHSSRVLKNGGVLVIEIGDAYQAEVLSSRNIPGLHFQGVFNDLGGLPRALMWRAYRL